MKSIKDNPIKNTLLDKFTPEIIKHIESEEFIIGNDDSYCTNFHDEYFDKCYKKYIESDSYTINVYIFEKGIGVDFDYTCGGNSFMRYWKFTDYTFEEAYDLMVDEINKFK